MGVNIGQQALSRIKHNKRMVTDYEFACLCQVLQVSERNLPAGFYNTAESERAPGRGLFLFYRP